MGWFILGLAVTFTTFLLCHQARAKERATWLYWTLERRRMAKERRAKFARLWAMVQAGCR